ncbi:hypothetical protein Bca4012_042418 [Brassica carinata]|uniref:Uncharacterized protein n=1 Tax=Brassica carinata TaxID=52824 RepID=A0A8X7R0C5_BRACI|nr:hypothetical protein Bca52824_059863 [Brassica carinata]
MSQVKAFRQGECIHIFRKAFQLIRYDMFAIVVKAFRKTLWIHSPFRAELYVNKTIHWRIYFIHIYMVRHNAMKMLASKVAYTYQEPQKHSSDEKYNKKNMIVYSVVENDLIDSAASVPDRPLNV